MCGTFKVQRGYPSTLKDKEGLPHRKNISPHNNMIMDEFDMSNVKEGNHGVTRALSLGPTTLSLGSMFLLMECSKVSMHPFMLQIFMRRFSWEDSSMDLTFNLLIMHGKKYISILVDYFIEYVHFLTMYV